MKNFSSIIEMLKGTKEDGFLGKISLMMMMMMMMMIKLDRRKELNEKTD